MTSIKTSLIEVDEYVKTSKYVHPNVIQRRWPNLLAKCKTTAKQKGSSWTEELYVLLYGTSVCTVCGKKAPFRNMRLGYRDFCSLQCANGAAATIAKRKATSLKRYGVDNPSKAVEIKQKILDTFVANYGTVSPMHHDPMVKEKRKRTMEKLYGAEYSGQSEELRNKRKASCLEKYGYEQAISVPEIREWAESQYKKLLPEIQERMKATNRERYGVDHPSQSREIAEKIQKSLYARKIVTVKGKTFDVQGYEDHAIVWLNAHGVAVRDILTTAAEGVPSIRYRQGTRQRVYHPDAYIKYKGNWYIVEVKSTFTAGLTDSAHHEVYDLLRRKAHAVHTAGYKFLLMVVYPGAGVRFINNVRTLTRAQAMDALAKSRLRP